MTAALPTLVLHAGTPKTGTKTLQAALHAARPALLRAGILFPDVGLTANHKHQWIVDLLVAGDLPAFRRHLAHVAEQARQCGARRGVLSAEGIYHHWSDFSPAARAALGEFARDFRVAAWATFREPVGFALSLYTQVLKNAPNPLVPCYGADFGFEDALADPWFTRRLDCSAFVAGIEALFGPGSFTATRYERGGAIEAARAILDVGAGVLPEVADRNRGLSATGIDLLRRLNRARLDVGQRQRVVASIIEIDQALGSHGGVPEVSAKARERVRAVAHPGLELLASRFGITWPAAVPTPEKGA
ncbi:MAG: hypothetical protein JNM90_10915 [Burkholderiales bacterium]|nr:hypothetical protein [Burkholderiales bacterium]